MNGSRTASVGGCFDGMGDFLVSDDEMKSIFGVDMVYPAGEELEAERNALSDSETKAEKKRLRASGAEIMTIDDEAYTCLLYTSEYIAEKENETPAATGRTESEIEAESKNFGESNVVVK